MKLQSHWEQIRAANGYDKLAQQDQVILEKVYYSGAVAFYAEFATAADPTSLVQELERFVADQKASQGPAN
jgi:hypothetical protein